MIPIRNFDQGNLAFAFQEILSRNLYPFHATLQPSREDKSAREAPGKLLRTELVSWR